MTTSHRGMPSVESVLRTEDVEALTEHYGKLAVTEAVRAIQAEQRKRSHPDDWAIDAKLYSTHIINWASQHFSHGYQKVFNLSGTILHTNLGRAVLDPVLLKNALAKVADFTTLEYDLRSGGRGQRERVVTERLVRLTGAEAATVVNNNAAAVFIVLNTLALGKEVLVSRGELIEIGGSFRLPDIMSSAGVQLHEVGTTNRTHLSDFDKAIGENCGLLMKVHPSNFHIEGFTSEVTTSHLGLLSRQTNTPLAVDLGSGALIDMERFNLGHEPKPQEVLRQGASVVTFSGDKLLGSTQAGLIIGKQELIDRIDSNPLKRALRLDKITLAILDESLKAYEEPEKTESMVPLLQMLGTPAAVLRERAERVATLLETILVDFTVEVVESQCQIGSGALPSQHLNSFAVNIAHTSSKTVLKLETMLRTLPIPVIGRVRKKELVLDMVCVRDLDGLLENLALIKVLLWSLR